MSPPSEESYVGRSLARTNRGHAMWLTTRVLCLGHALRGVFQTSSSESVFSEFTTKSFNLQKGFLIMLLKIIHTCREIWKGPHQHACRENSNIMARSCEGKDPFAPSLQNKHSSLHLCGKRENVPHPGGREAGRSAPPTCRKAPSGAWKWKWKQSRKFYPSPQHTCPSTNPTLSE